MNFSFSQISKTCFVSEFQLSGDGAGPGGGPGSAPASGPPGGRQEDRWGKKKWRWLGKQKEQQQQFKEKLLGFQLKLRELSKTELG